MLSREEVVDLARQEGLGEVADDLVARVRPAWRLEPGDTGDPSRAATTKVGGHPDLGPGETWPVNRRGVPMTFLAQVDCSGLPAFDPPWLDPRPWRHGDLLLRLFADLFDNPIEPGIAIGLACEPTGPLARTEPPLSRPPPGGPWDDLSLEERFRTLPEAPLRAVPFLTAPEGPPPALGDLEEAEDGYLQWTYRLRIDGEDMDDELERQPWEVHHLLGEPCSIQEDVRGIGGMFYGDAWFAEVMGLEPDPNLVGEDAWRVLLALHDDERLGLEIHDAGAFHVLAPVEDLASGRLDRLVCSVDSG